MRIRIDSMREIADDGWSFPSPDRVQPFYAHRVTAPLARLARWAGLLRPRPSTETEPRDDEAVHTERARRNLSRQVPVLATMLAVHVAHVLTFLMRDAESSPARVAWHHQILWTHASYAVVALAGILAAPVAQRALSRGRNPYYLPELMAFAYLFFGAILAMFDQAVTVAITPYIAATIALAVTARLSPVLTVASQAFGFTVFVVGQLVAQPDPEVRLSNLVNGATLAAFAVVLGIVLTRAEGREVLQQRLILRQKQALEEALAQVRALAERAEAANRAKGTFLGSMSHEVRTPLNAILGISSLLEDELVDAQHRDWLATIQQSGRTLLALLDDLLVMSRLEAQHVELRPGACDPRALVREVCAAFEADVRAKGLVLDVELGAELPPLVTADDTRLRQVAFNLVGNAVKFTERGRVQVRAHTKAAEHPGHVDLTLEVEDTGRGIAPDERERIFEPFVQGRRDRSETKPDGTGLGLAISGRLVGLMGGHIDVDSELGRGSRFTVHLPEVALRAEAR